MVNIASWNIRGLNQSSKQKLVRQVILENSLSVCAVLETHLAKVNLAKVSSFVFPNWKWSSNSDLCNRGARILLGWDPCIVDLMILAQSDQVIHSQIFLKDEKKMLFVSFIYAHNHYIDRRALWSNLSRHKRFILDKPWCILGDFNATLSISDSIVGTSGKSTSMREFSDCINDIGCMDIKQIGLEFTWNQKPRGADGILRKLDRIMAELEFLKVFVGATAVFKPYISSDHSPAILKLPTKAKFKPKPFKFANLLVLDKKFKDVVRDIWEEQVTGFSMYQVVQKLKSLKKPLRKLLIDKGNIHNNVTNLRMELEKIQMELDKDPHNPNLREAEAIHLQNYNEAVITEERFLKQKAKIEWLQVGDSNSAYFHRVVKTRVARNHISFIHDATGRLVDGNDVYDTFVNHYLNFLGKQGHTNDFDVAGVISKYVTDQKAAQMVCDISDEEIKSAMFSMGDDKSPGPDGYSAAFFKNSWDIIGHDVMDAVREFFVSGKLLKELNHTAITLIPKVLSPSTVSDFRPISLCNILYKCISKIIANRIQDSLSDIVSMNQSAFIPGRSISDNILLTQDIMHNYHLNRGPPRCALKVDIQKAYDTVDWNFLEAVLCAFGFPRKIVDWIMVCVTSVTFSLSINGHMHGYFRGKRGLRQGDPLSPYLFTLVMEILTLILHKRVQESTAFSFHQHCQELQVINLCFADDLFIFLRANRESATVIMNALDEFANASGLVSSLPKSTVYFSNVRPSVKMDILSIIPFKEGSLPVKYLGVPLVSSRLLVRDCKPLVEQIHKRLDDWRNKYLSFAGRVQLINSVISAIHVYWSSVFILPTNVIMEIEQLMRGFLWCQGEMKKGKAKVAWDDVCLPKEEGGLGIRKIRPFNIALFSIQIWKLITSKESLWVKWVHTHKLRGTSFWNVPIRGNMSWSWRMMLQIRPIIRQFCWVRIGNGQHTFAWFDNWCAESPLFDRLTPRLINSSDLSLNSKVSDLVINGDWRHPCDWKNRFANTLIPPVLNDSTDLWFWKDRNGIDQNFSAHMVWEDIRPRAVEISWCNIVWYNYCIPKHAFILWLAFRNRLKTQDMLLNWTTIPVSELLCPLCSQQHDSRSHLFFECNYSSQVWLRVAQKAGLQPRPCQWDQIVTRLIPRAKKKSAQNVIDKLIFAATVYYVWQERNARLFKKVSRPIEVVAEAILSTVRLKMMTFKYKRTSNVERFLDAWDLPVLLITHD